MKAKKAGLLEGYRILHQISQSLFYLLQMKKFIHWKESFGDINTFLTYLDVFIFNNLVVLKTRSSRFEITTTQRFIESLTDNILNSLKNMIVSLITRFYKRSIKRKFIHLNLIYNF